jgi:uncharacterized protein YkwD
MNKLVSFTILLMLVLSACEKQAATQAPATRTPPPASPSNCTDSASFVADVTAPDGANFKQGEGFLKTWRIKNTGTCTWAADYQLVFASGEQMDAPAEVPLEQTAPGGTLEVSVPLKAPARDGAFTGNFELRNASGKSFEIDKGQYLWVKVTVGTVAARPTAAPLSESPSCTYTENADFVSQLLTLVNTARASNGLPALTLNSQLSSAAQAHSRDMACHSQLSHSGSQGSSLASRLAAEGYTYSTAMENIYAQPPQFGGNPQAAMDWWMNDQIHRDAILDGRITQLGIGYAFVQGSELGGYFTLDFAAP